MQVTLVGHIPSRLRWEGSRILQLAAAAAICLLLNGVAANSRPAGRWPGRGAAEVARGLQQRPCGGRHVEHGGGGGGWAALPADSQMTEPLTTR